MKDISKVLDDIGATDIRTVKNGFNLNPAIVVGLIADYYALQSRTPENALYFNVKDEIIIPETITAEYDGIPLAFASTQGELYGSIRGELLFVGYNGNTSHPRFFQTFYLPYAMSASFNHDMYSIYSVPVIYSIGKDSPDIRSNEVIVPLVTSAARDALEENAKSLEISIQEVMFAWLKVRAAKNLNVNLAIPTKQQMELSKRIFEINYMVQERRYC